MDAIQSTIKKEEKMLNIEKLKDLLYEAKLHYEKIYFSQLSEACYITFNLGGWFERDEKLFSPIKVQFRASNHNYDARRKGWREGTKILEARTEESAIKILKIAQKAINNRKNKSRWAPPPSMVRINHRWVLREEKDYFLKNDAKQNYKYYTKLNKEKANVEC